VTGDWILVNGATGLYRCERCKAPGYGIRARQIASARVAESPGFQRNGFFCSIRCGFDWAVKKLEAEG
jgi:hypothetical protein